MLCSANACNSLAEPGEARWCQELHPMWVAENQAFGPPPVSFPSAEGPATQAASLILIVGIASSGLTGSATAASRVLDCDHVEAAPWQVTGGDSKTLAVSYASTNYGTTATHERTCKPHRPSPLPPPSS